MEKIYKVSSDQEKLPGESKRSAATVFDMERSVKLALVVVVISMLVSCNPTEAWYKQVAGPSYYSVGRASGLLSGIRRSPYIRRAEPESSDSAESTLNSVLSEPSSRKNSVLKSMVSNLLLKQLSFG